MKKAITILLTLITLLSITMTASAKESPKAVIDTTNANNGTVTITLKDTITSRLRVRLVNNKKTLVYNINNTETTTVPLTLGNGTYTIDLMQNTTGTKYKKIATTEINVELKHDYSPYMTANMACVYTKNDKVAKLATTLTSKSKTTTQKVDKIYNYISSNIKYDKVKMTTVQSTYIPDPSTTLKTKQGICYDYASLMAAMCRSQNIPCKIVVG